MFRRGILILVMFLSGCATLSPKFVTKIQNSRLDYATAGQGAVTVVFESGLGDGMDTWEPVFDQVSSFATTFAYDRPGYGGSDDISGSRTGRDAVESLRILLAQVELSPPYVLVGHSMGGQYVELYARLYPDEVAGVVLVDSRHPEFTRRCEERLGRGECGVPGLMRLIMPGHMKRELDAADTTADQIRAAPSFPDVELVVLSRSEGSESREWLELWMEMQREYAALSRLSRLIVSESGHYVHHDDPGTVIEAVQGVAARVQDDSGQTIRTSRP